MKESRLLTVTLAGPQDHEWPHILTLVTTLPSHAPLDLGRVGHPLKGPSTALGQDEDGAVIIHSDIHRAGEPR